MNRSTSWPAVSVVMAVYNGAAFLEEAILSIRAQSYRGWEFIIIDDGSTDATPAILARHAAADPRLRILTQPNAGLIASLNRGFEEARGEYIARMDADDISRPYRLEMQLDFLSANAGIALVGGAIETIDARGRVIGVIALPARPRDLREHMLKACNIAHPTVLFRKRALQITGGFRRAYRVAEDYDLWLRMMQHFDLANLPDVLLRYRRHTHSASLQHVRQQALSALAARVTARLRLSGGHDPTSEVDLITPAVLRQLGLADQDIEDEVFARLVVAAEDAIRCGAPLQVTRFRHLAGPSVPSARVRRASAELNIKAIRAHRNVWARMGHLLALLRSDRAAFLPALCSVLNFGYSGGRPSRPSAAP